MRRTRWIVSLAVLVTLLAWCSTGEAVAQSDGPGAGAPGSSTTVPTTTTGATTTTLAATTTTSGGSTIEPATTIATTTTIAPPTTTTTAPPPPTAPPASTAPPPTTSPPTTSPPTTAPPTTPGAPDSTGAAPATWTVKTGESFWSIAAAVAAQRLGRPPTAAEVDPIWRATIERNWAILPRPGDPDLIYVGMELTIP